MDLKEFKDYCLSKKGVYRTIPEGQLLFLIDLSYELVYKGLKKSEKLALE